jgi:hypothetical protein
MFLFIQPTPLTLMFEWHDFSRNSYKGYLPGKNPTRECLTPLIIQTPFFMTSILIIHFFMPQKQAGAFVSNGMVHRSPDSCG